MATYPDPQDVREGVVYGPNDDDYTGQMGRGGGVHTVRTETEIEEVPILIPPFIVEGEKAQ